MVCRCVNTCIIIHVVPVRVSGSDVEGGGMVREGGGGRGLQEQHTVRFLQPSQVEQVCVLVESVPGRMTV